MDIDKDLENLLSLADGPEINPGVPEIKPDASEPKPSTAPLVARDASGKPLPNSQLTDEQKEIRRLQDLLAKQDAKKLENLEDEEVVATGDNRILIHLVTDRFTALGRQWYKGQEIEFEIGSVPYEDTKDRTGHSWLTLTESQQMDRYGEVRFRKGPWPGKDYSDPTASEKEKARRRAAPTMPRI
jgi:hypothetical protein